MALPSQELLFTACRGRRGSPAIAEEDVERCVAGPFIVNHPVRGVYGGAFAGVRGVEFGLPGIPQPPQAGRGAHLVVPGASNTPRPSYGGLVGSIRGSMKSVLQSQALSGLRGPCCGCLLGCRSRQKKGGVLLIAVLLGAGSWWAPSRVSTAVVRALGGQLWAPSAPVSRRLTYSARTYLIRCYLVVDTHTLFLSAATLLRGEVDLPSSVVYGLESMPLHPSCATSPSVPGV